MDEFRQDEDVMDTWFSSWIWPIQVFDGLHKEDEVVLLPYERPRDGTGNHVLLVARMIISGYHYRRSAVQERVLYRHCA